VSDFYRDAVRRARQLVEQIASAQWELGELAEQVEKKYSARTLASFARAIGINAETLNHYRSTVRAWAGIQPAPAELPFSVLQELAAHPDRAQIVADNPKITTRKARDLMREYRRNEKAEDVVSSDDDPWAQLPSDLLVLANKVLGVPPPDEWPTFDASPALVQSFRKALPHLAAMAKEIDKRAPDAPAKPTLLIAYVPSRQTAGANR
jgi:hypothetical protein